MSLKTDPIRRGELRMTQFNTRKAATRQVALAAASALALTLGFAGAASAQSATSTLRGVVYDGQNVETGGVVTATDAATGYVTRGRIGENGQYVIPGLRPGTFRIQVTTSDGQTTEDTVTLALGQVGTLNLDVASAPAAASTDGATTLGDIVVTGRRIFDVRTSEVGTSVSQQQINNLPQINRNFLNFAALAPGVRDVPLRISSTRS